MVCDDPDRAATWRQSIRAPRPVPAFPLSGPPPVTGLGILIVAYALAMATYHRKTA